jgi:uncharacterized OB-fold protein
MSDTTVPTLPRPILSNEMDPLAAAFYAACARGRLHFQRCGACGTWRHLPRHTCAACGSATWSWEPSSGRGRLFSWTVTHQASLPGLATPYVVGIVETDEGVRLAAGLLDADPAALRLDLPVVVALVSVSEAAAVPFFRLA